MGPIYLVNVAGFLLIDAYLLTGQTVILKVGIPLLFVWVTVVSWQGFWKLLALFRRGGPRRDDMIGNKILSRVFYATFAFTVCLSGWRFLPAQISRDECAASVRRTIPAPGGALSAVVFEMECGATVPFNTQVSIVPTGKSFSPSQFPSFLSLHGQLDPDVTWRENTVVEIHLPPDATAYRKEPQAAGVAVVYR